MLMSLKKGIYSYNEEIIVSNIKKHLDNLKEFTSTKGYGVTRLPFTK